MLTEAQKKDITNFTVHFTRAIHNMTNATKEQTEIMVQLGTSALLGAVLRIPPPTDDTIDGIDCFVIDAIAFAMKCEYDKAPIIA